MTLEEIVEKYKDGIYDKTVALIKSSNPIKGCSLYSYIYKSVEEVYAISEANGYCTIISPPQQYEFVEFMRVGYAEKFINEHAKEI